MTRSVIALGAMWAAVALFDPGAFAADPPPTAPPPSPPTPASAPAAPGAAVELQPILAELRQQAEALQGFAESGAGIAFLAAASLLEPAPVRVVYRDPVDRRRYYPADQVAALPAPRSAALERVELEPQAYYTTRYGTPLAYVRAIDLAGQHGLETLREKRVLDFGYGAIGHLRMLAHAGAHAVGVDIDSYLRALYAESADQGKLASGGSVRLVDGRWPGDEAVRAAVGESCDLFLSKNTLKRGYVHPERPAEPRTLIDLGASDEAFLAQVFRVLSPGGLAVIYNLCPAQSAPAERYIPWADGRFPFERSHAEAAGFEVVALDVDDSGPARAMARRLGWDKSGMDIDKDLFAHYTILRKPQHE